MILSRKKREERNHSSQFPSSLYLTGRLNHKISWALWSLFPQLVLWHPQYGGWKTPFGFSLIHSHAIGKELCYWCVDLWHTSLRCLPLISRGARLGYWLFGGANTASPRGSCGLWMPATAYLPGGFSIGMLQAIKLTVRQGRLMREMRACNLSFPYPPS